MKVFVTGFESSGTKWVASILSQHQELQVTHGSCPEGWGTDRHYVDFPEDHILVIVVRDRTCQEESVRRLGYNNDTPKSFSFEDNVACLSKYMKLSKQTVFVSYETLVMWQQQYCDQVFRAIGVPTVNIHTYWRDENMKYFHL